MHPRSQRRAATSPPPGAHTDGNRNRRQIEFELSELALVAFLSQGQATRLDPQSRRSAASSAFSWKPCHHSNKLQNRDAHVAFLGLRCCSTATNTRECVGSHLVPRQRWGPSPCPPHHSLLPNASSDRSEHGAKATAAATTSHSNVSCIVMEGASTCRSWKRRTGKALAAQLGPRGCPSAIVPVELSQFHSFTGT